MLDDSRVGVGRIEEVFGPVCMPFYALRWAPGPEGAVRVQPEGLKRGALMSVVGRLVAHIRPEELVRFVCSVQVLGGVMLRANMICG